MVNKAIVGILALIVLTSLGVGVLIGTQLGGSGDGATDPGTDNADDGSESTATDGGQSTETNETGNETAGNETATPVNGTAVNGTATRNETATPTPDGTSAPTPTVTTTATTTATPTPTQTTIASREFDGATIEREIVEDVNEGRSERGLASLSTSGSTANDLREMVRIHSQAMANERVVAFQLNDYANASERYEGNDLRERCKYQHSEDGFINQPDNSFQAVGKTIAGREYERSGTTRFNRNEEMVAEAIVDDWFSSSTYRRPLENDQVELIGIGVTVTDDGKVYAAAAICS